MTWVPQACTLPVAEQPLRVAEFDALFASAVRPAVRSSPTCLRVFLAGGAAIAAHAQDLITRETECCSFFTFALQTSDGGTELEVRVPTARVDILDARACGGGSLLEIDARISPRSASAVRSRQICRDCTAYGDRQGTLRTDPVWALSAGA